MRPEGTPEADRHHTFHRPFRAALHFRITGGYHHRLISSGPPGLEIAGVFQRLTDAFRTGKQIL
jgi:hypothetical protein